jgi:hypothetical protein
MKRARGRRAKIKNYWVHVLCDGKAAHYVLQEKRGKAGRQDRLADYDGVGVHDCWGSYFTFETPRPTVGNAPILQELFFFQEVRGCVGRAN